MENRPERPTSTPYSDDRLRSLTLPQNRYSPRARGALGRQAATRLLRSAPALRVTPDHAPCGKPLRAIQEDGPLSTPESGRLWRRSVVAEWRPEHATQGDERIEQPNTNANSTQKGRRREQIAAVSIISCPPTADSSQLHDGASRGRLIEDAHLGGFGLLFRRVVEIRDVVRVELRSRERNGGGVLATAPEMKCSCDAERSFSAEARHFVMKAWGVTASAFRPRP